MLQASQISDTARVIQLAIDPVFLLSGVSSVIASLFISAFTKVDVSLIVAGLFVAAMAALIITLLLFLREVFLATRVLSIGPH